MPAPRLCLSGAAGGARRGGFGGGRGNLRAFGRRTAEKTGANGAKSRTRGRFRASGAGRAPGFEAAAGASLRGAPGEGRAAPGQNGAVGRPSGAGTASVEGEKPPFAAKRAGNGAVAGQKLAEKAGGVCRVIRNLQGIFGRFRRKSWGFGKAFPRAYRKDLPFAPFLCRWRTVIWDDNLVVRSGCFFCHAE